MPPVLSALFEISSYVRNAGVTVRTLPRGCQWVGRITVSARWARDGAEWSGVSGSDVAESWIPHTTFTTTPRNVTGGDPSLPASWTTAKRADGTSTAPSPVLGAALRSTNSTWTRRTP